MQVLRLIDNMTNNKFLKKISVLLLVAALTATFAGCAGNEQTTGANGDETTAPVEVEHVDYAGSIQLDMTSSTKKAEATVKTFVDGDTTHFYADLGDGQGETVVKARYIAINTPESTGKIEEWGKAASNYTRSVLEQENISIIIESDSDSWETDSTGSRYLLWIWYKTDDMADYRNLNIEILQQGLAIASSSANNRYGSICVNAINQAKAEKLNIYSGEKDPDFFYGDAIELDLKELRTNVEAYNGQKVAFNGIVVMNSNNTAYVEYYDSESNMYYGMTVYYGYSLNAKGVEIMSVGNEVRVVGTVSYYETGGTWQVSGLTYKAMKPNDPSNIQCISSGNEGAFPLTSASTLLNGKVSIEVGDETKEFTYGELALSSSISLENLKVVSTYTTVDEESSSYGAITITCKAEDGTEIKVRTIVLKDANGNMVTEDIFQGKVLNVRGIVDYFSGSYQIKVFSLNDIEILSE